MATQNAIRSIPADKILKALNRHIISDWGELCGEDWKANEDAHASSDPPLLGLPRQILRNHRVG
jgi:hypothetical protein